MPTSSSSKSHLPNWLDKLRIVKSFASVNDAHTPDHFLSPQPQPQPQHHQQQQHQEPIDAADDDHLQNDDVSTRMARMLSDLFSDGRSSKFKAPRKQPSPRICILPAAAAAVVTEDKGSSDSDRNLESKRKLRRRRGLKERRKQGECDDLVGFSRTEVTVIDSSNPLWKFRKYMFRKKNVWKARDCRRGNSLGR